MTLITALFTLAIQVVYVGIVFIFAGLTVNSIMIRL